MAVNFDESATDMGAYYDKLDPLVYEEMLRFINYCEVGKICEAAIALNLPKDIEIMDIGAGSGVVGIDLKAAGYTNIDAVDASERFLEALKDKELYRSAHHIYMGAGDFPRPGMENHYDLVTSAGTWLTNHIPKEGIPEIVSCMKKGGIWVLALRSKFLADDEEMGYGPMFAK